MLLSSASRFRSYHRVREFDSYSASSKLQLSRFTLLRRAICAVRMRTLDLNFSTKNSTNSNDASCEDDDGDGCGGGDGDVCAPSVRSTPDIEKNYAHRVRMRTLDLNFSTKNSTNSNDASCEDGDGDGGGDGDVCAPSVRSTPDIEKNYVHRVYDAIAPHFSSTRFAKWPKVAEFLNSLKSGSVILDAGCGNGKYLGLNPDCFYIGCDISPPLVEICARRGHQVMVADAVNLPYRDNFGDAAISVAVLHHLSTETRRRKAVEELIRVVRKGGLVLITVWAVEQEDQSLLAKWTPLFNKYDDEWVDSSSISLLRNQSNIKLESIPEAAEDLGASKQIDNQVKDDRIAVSPSVPCAADNGCSKAQQEYFVPWHLPFHRAEIGGGASASALENGLAKKDEKKGAIVYNRYYHVFAEGELRRLVSGVENAAVVDQFYDKSNWCIVLEKI